MATLHNIYPVFKPLGHMGIVSFDIVLAFFYYRNTPDVCFFELKLWVYGQFILHAWLTVVAMAQLFEYSPSAVQEHRGKILSLGLKFWWVLYAAVLFYTAEDCITLAPLLYWWVGVGATVLALSIAFEWKNIGRREYGERGPAPPVVVFEKVFEKVFSAHGTADLCPICLEQFSRGDTVSVLPCAHFYHPACIYEWLRTRLQCPVCRTPVASESEAEAEARGAATP